MTQQIGGAQRRSQSSCPNGFTPLWNFEICFTVISQLKESHFHIAVFVPHPRSSLLSSKNGSKFRYFVRTRLSRWGGGRDWFFWLAAFALYSSFIHSFYFLMWLSTSYYFYCLLTIDPRFKGTIWSSFGRRSRRFRGSRWSARRSRRQQRQTREIFGTKIEHCRTDKCGSSFHASRR